MVKGHAAAWWLARARLQALDHHHSRILSSQPDSPDGGALPGKQGVRKSKPRPNRAKMRRGNGETAAELANGPAEPDAAAAPSEPAAAAPTTAPAPPPAEETQAAAVSVAAAADVAVAEQAAPAEPVRVGRLVPARQPRTGNQVVSGKRKTLSEVRPPKHRQS